MYSQYETFLKNITRYDIATIDFKRNPAYMEILEHTSPEQGRKYLEYILAEFPYITFDQIKHFILMNDKYGNAYKEYIVIDGQRVESSPSNMRYIYHALLIIDHYRKSPCVNIVEIGGGYGGLCLAISYFSAILEIEIQSYTIVDLPIVCELIEKYLGLHTMNMHFVYSTKSAYLYGTDIDKPFPFVISNYCFTEVERNHREQYVKGIIHKAKAGFMVWQTWLEGMGTDNISTVLQKKVHKIEEERPQTNPSRKNFFVYF